MTIGNAMKFIDEGSTNNELRNALNRAESIPQLYQVLAERNLSFSSFEFEDAFNNRLVSCQFAEQAEHLQEFRQWWEMLHRFLGVEYGKPAGECESSHQCAVSGGCSSCGS